MSFQTTVKSPPSCQEFQEGSSPGRRQKCQSCTPKFRIPQQWLRMPLPRFPQNSWDTTAFWGPVTIHAYKYINRGALGKTVYWNLLTDFFFSQTKQEGGKGKEMKSEETAVGGGGDLTSPPGSVPTRPEICRARDSPPYMHQWSQGPWRTPFLLLLTVEVEKWLLEHSNYDTQKVNKEPDSAGDTPRATHKNRKRIQSWRSTSLTGWVNVV